VSFILDALKKSERERQRAAVPGISDLPVVVHESGTSAWTIAIIAALSIGIAALSWVWLRAPIPQTPTVAETPALPIAAEPAPAAARVASPPATSSPAATRSLASEASRGVTPSAQVPGAAQASQLAVTAPNRVSGGTVTEAPMSILDARAAGMSVPQLALELLVYSDDPGQRFVYVNGVKYVEGETLSEGPRVVEITTEGPILNYAGRDYLLPQN